MVGASALKRLSRSELLVLVLVSLFIHLGSLSSTLIILFGIKLLIMLKIVFFDI